MAPHLATACLIGMLAWRTAYIIKNISDDRLARAGSEEMGEAFVN